MPLKRSASIAKRSTTPFAVKTARRRRSNPRIFRVSERSPPRKSPRRKISRNESASIALTGVHRAALSPQYKMVPKDRKPSEAHQGASEPSIMEDWHGPHQYQCLISHRPARFGK